MDPREVGKASAIAAGMCVLAALLVAPQLWWLGLAAGIAAGLTSGYVSYDFRKVVLAIPIAWNRTKLACDVVGGRAFRKIVAFFRRPHPFGYGAMLGGLTLEILVVALFVARSIGSEASPAEPPTPRTMGLVWALILGPGLLWVLSSMVMGLLLVCFAAWGAKIERCYWLDPGVDERWQRIQYQEGYREVLFTYRTIYYLAWVGFRRAAWVVFAFFVWRGWVWLWRKACFIGRFYRRFGGELFRLIHSEGRVVSALYGTAGGVVALLVGHAHVATAPEKVLLVFFGVLLGFALGRGVACELVAKRWLGLTVRS